MVMEAIVPKTSHRSNLDKGALLEVKMSIFLILLVIGMSGLVFMALPAFGHHAGGHAGGHDLSAGHDISHISSAHGTIHHDTGNISGHSHTFAGIIPSPRTVFSLLALFGAFGEALEHWTPYARPVVAGIALIPAYLVERLLVTPLWNLLVSFSSPPVASLQALTLNRATAITNFTHGRGMVSVTREGREVQFLAQLIDEQSEVPVHQGDSLFIDEVDDAKERLTVRIR